MAEKRTICGCISLRWAAMLAELVIMSISIVILVMSGLYSSSFLLNSTFTAYVVHICAYGPIIGITAIGMATIGKRNGRGLANTLKWLYINIFMIVIVEIISIIFLATTRSSAIITGCQYNHLDQISTLDYLTNPLNAALEVNSGCHRYWVHIVLVYTAVFVSSLIIMLGCVYVIRMYLNELQDSNEEYVIGMNQTMQDVEDEYKPMVPDFKYHSWKQDPTEDTNRDLYDSRATLYSKIYQKNVLRQKDYMKQSLGSLHPPEYTPQPNIKSPTLERMEYSRFKEHGAGHVPLEREGMNLSPGEPLPTNPSDPLADASEPSVDPSDSLADRSDSPEPENDRLLRR